MNIGSSLLRCSHSSIQITTGPLIICLAFPINRIFILRSSPRCQTLVRNKFRLYLRIDNSKDLGCWWEVTTSHSVSEQIHEIALSLTKKSQDILQDWGKANLTSAAAVKRINIAQCRGIFFHFPFWVGEECEVCLPVGPLQLVGCASLCCPCPPQSPSRKNVDEMLHSTLPQFWSNFWCFPVSPDPSLAYWSLERLHRAFSVASIWTTNSLVLTASHHHLTKTAKAADAWHEGWALSPISVPF